MMRRTFGAPLGGTTDGGQYDLESLAFSLITPPNFGGGGGSCLPSIVVVALGDPGCAVFRSSCLVACCADTTSASPDANSATSRMVLLRISNSSRGKTSCSVFRRGDLIINNLLEFARDP